ncbi:MAG: ABC transporter ATP-binding protein [Solirubrobacterales bacterium]|nr:ABC transporter ATP-binding protein [Solirubrobacterales bacterium]
MARIGVDEWVAESDQRTEGYRGRASPLVAAWDRVPPAARILLLAVGLAVFPLTTGSDFVLRVGINTLLLAILALGLNVVVGWAGLLDLGYIAFYGFGAYTYALLSSEQLGIHLPTPLAVLIVLVACALLGLLLGLPSRRLLGDYLAIVTLFFGQIFVELVVNLDAVTGGPSGIAGVDPFVLLGFEFLTPRDYYYLTAGAAVIVTLVLYLIGESRTGRAWRAVREDPLAAEMMTMPVNLLKLKAFALGSAIAGLAGSIFAAVQIGVFPRNFETPFLILIYAAVILGGAGSLAGAILGAVVVSVSLELLRDADQATVLFYGLLLAGLLARVRPWRKLAAVLGGTIALGLALHAIAAAVWPEAVAGTPQATGALGDALDAWLVLPEGATTAGNIGFVVLVAAIILFTQVRERTRTLLLVPVIYLAAFVWEARLVQEPSVTRQLLLGALLVVVMISRPRGLLGSERKEIV